MKTITLKTAIKRGEKTEIKEVGLREPKAGELRGLKLAEVLQLDVNAQIELLPRITEPSLTAQELREMNLADFTQLSTGIADFFGVGEVSPAQ